MVINILTFLAGGLVAFTCFYFGLKFNVQIQKGEVPKIELPTIPNPIKAYVEHKEQKEQFNVIDEWLNGPKEG